MVVNNNFNSYLEEFLWIESIFQSINSDIKIHINEDHEYMLFIPNDLSMSENDFLHIEMKKLVRQNVLSYIYYIENDMRFITNQACIK